MGVIIHQEIKRLVRWRGWPLTASLGLLLVIALVAPLEEGIAIGGDDSFELGKSLLLARGWRIGCGMTSLGFTHC